MTYDLMAAKQFRDDRIAAGLPVGTKDQHKRAAQIAVGMHAHLNTPLGLELLAVSIPLSKAEKLANRRLEEDPIVLKPMIDSGKYDVEAEQVEAFLASNPAIQEPEQAVESIMAGHGYSNPAHVLKRVGRYVKQARPGKPPQHIANMLRLLSACRQATDILVARKETAA